MDEVEQKAMGVRREALSYLEQVENDFVREALLAMFDVKSPTPTEHARGLIRVCDTFGKTFDDFMEEWNNDPKARQLTREAINLFHRTVGAKTAESTDRMYFWLKTVVHHAESLLTHDSGQKAEFQKRARQALKDADVYE